MLFNLLCSVWWFLTVWQIIVPLLWQIWSAPCTLRKRSRDLLYNEILSNQLNWNFPRHSALKCLHTCYILELKKVPDWCLFCTLQRFRICSWRDFWHADICMGGVSDVQNPCQADHVWCRPDGGPGSWTAHGTGAFPVPCRFPIVPWEWPWKTLFLWLL